MKDQAGLMLLKNMVSKEAERFWATICSTDLVDFSVFWQAGHNFPYNGLC